MNRRDFLKGAFASGAALAASGCLTKRGALSTSGSMHGYHDGPIPELRVGLIGVSRGWAAMDFLLIPHCRIVAVCDVTPERAERAAKHVREKSGRECAMYTGAEDYKRVCERDDVDLVWNATPWQLHVPVALYAMEHGKHVVTEVPSAFTVEQCWSLVETSERTRRHCMQLENCCYGETEMLALNLVRQGLLGELVHGEGAYIHDLRKWNYGDFNPNDGMNNYWDFWRLRWNANHAGNQYPTHGLGPIALDMDVNRGDRFDFLVSVDSKQTGFVEYAKAEFGADSWKGRLVPKMGDMNSTLIRTAKGRTILVQHDVGTCRPYDRLNLIQGTRGIMQDYPFRCAFESKVGEGVHEYSAKFADEVRAKYMHPLWKQAGEIAKRVGGHGGMDFLMTLKLAYNLQAGRPLDTDVYDLASWCSICELTEISASNRGRSMDIPDFTAGGWETAEPLAIEGVDLKMMGLA